MLAVSMPTVQRKRGVMAMSMEGDAMTATARDRETASAIAATGPCVQGCAQCEGVMADRIADALAQARKEGEIAGFGAGFERGLAEGRARP